MREGERVRERERGREAREEDQHTNEFIGCMAYGF